MPMMRRGNRTLYDDTVTSQSLTYGSTNNRLTAIDSQSVTTDNNGNITSIHGMTLAYDAHNRLSSAIVSSLTTNYAYNGIGERVTKQTGSNIRHYFYNGPQLLAEYDATGNVEREYIYLNGQPVVMLDHSGSGIDIYWIHNDHLGRPLALTDEVGDVVWKLTNADAFGNAASINEDPDNDSTNLTFNIRFPGQYHNEETGLSYNYFRTYDPKTGRYVESDPIGLRGGLNTYLYANANPIIFTDPEGLRFRPAVPAYPAAPAAPGGGIGPGNFDTTAPFWPKPVIDAVKGYVCFTLGACNIPHVDDPEAEREHDAYKERASQTPDPNWDKCTQLKFELAREQDVVQAMKDWDAKWLPGQVGRHVQAIQQRQSAINRIKQQIEKECNEKCP